MGRHRNTNSPEMPTGMAKKGNSFYFVSKGPKRKWIKLPDRFNDAVAMCISLKIKEATGDLALCDIPKKANQYKPRMHKPRSKISHLSPRFSTALQDKPESVSEMDHLLSDAVVHKMHFSTVNGARRKKLSHTITREDVRNLLKQSDGVCQVTGIKFNFSPYKDAVQRPWIPSIDRINSSRGYIKGNCRIVCFAANLAMNQWGEDVLIEISKAIGLLHKTNNILPSCRNPST